MFALICVCLGLVQAIENECGKYATCKDCLNITAGHDTGGRTDCGWCHDNIQYANGTTGKRCADIRDSPWHCRDQYDTYKCSVGWKCNETSGQCKPDMAGEGYGSNTTCSTYCNPHPHNETMTYQCNTTSYECKNCTKGEEGCDKDKVKACQNCKAPPETKWKCDKTDPEKPKCEQCKGNATADCKSHKEACNNCAPPAKLSKCDVKTLTCKPDKTGSIKAACDASCGHHTPTNLLGIWRGLMVSKGAPADFDMGEIDMVFGEKNLTVRYPNKTQDIYDVSTTGGGQMTLTKDNDTIKVVINELINLKHTAAMGMSTYGPGKEAPDSFKIGVDSNKSLSLAMWKCQDYGADKKCSFASSKSENQYHNLDFTEDPQDPPPGDIDACNKYDSCHTCINASTSTGVECGWCLGGTLNYSKIGNTSFKCGGFKAGSPH